MQLTHDRKSLNPLWTAQGIVFNTLTGGLSPAGRPDVVTLPWEGGRRTVLVRGATAQRWTRPRRRLRGVRVEAPAGSERGRSAPADLVEQPARLA